MMEHGNGLHGEVVKSLPLEIFKSHLLSDRTRSWATCCRCLWLSRNVGPSSSGPLKSQLFCDSVIFFYGTLSTSPALSHFLLGGLKESLMLPCMASIIVYWLLEHLKFNAKINTNNSNLLLCNHHLCSMHSTSYLHERCSLYFMRQIGLYFPLYWSHFGCNSIQ